MGSGELDSRRAEMVAVFEGTEALRESLKPLVELEVRRSCVFTGWMYWIDLLCVQASVSRRTNYIDTTSRRLLCVQ